MTGKLSAILLSSTPMFSRLLCLLLGLAAATPLWAAPMGFRDSWMVMGEFSSEFRELTVNKAVTVRDALGVTAVQMRAHDGHPALDNEELTYTRLVSRWNLPNAQANVWFFGGVGRTTEHGNAREILTISPGLQADYETTRVYAAVYARGYRGEGLQHSISTARAGFSFYEVDYDEVQPWLILEARKMTYLSNDTELTPMLRLIHKRFFVEGGVNTDGRARLNVMTLF